MKTPLLKFCGNRSLSDYQKAVESLADYIGVVFYKKSKRYVKPETVAEWVRQVEMTEKQELVGVFVNPSMEEMDSILNTVQLDIIQLHGSESPQMVKDVREKFNKKVWKAIHHDSNSLKFMQSYYGVVDGYVIDCKIQNLWGGTGKSFDWTDIPDYQCEADNQGVPCFIAGGVSPLNIEKLLTYQPSGIDMASGIENNGEKSEHFIREIERKVVRFNEYLSR